ncbi:MAG: hypothetical protein V3V19_11185 [Cocleimonas sp.]
MNENNNYDLAVLQSIIDEKKDFLIRKQNELKLISMEITQVSRQIDELDAVHKKLDNFNKISNLPVCRICNATFYHDFEKSDNVCLKCEPKEVTSHD